MSSDASCEESSVRKGMGYDEAFGFGHESEDFSLSSKRGTSARSPDGNESCTGEDEVEDEVENGREDEGVEGGINADGDNSDGDDSDGDEGDGEEGLGDNRPFILPEDWAVNKFLPRMSNKIFGELRTRYQIPDHIPIRLPEENEACYLGRTADVGMYDAMFAAGLRLSLTALHRQLADFLGLSVTQIAPNAWRTFIGVKILWGRLSGSNRQLSLDEFFYCYRPHHITSSKGT